MKVKINENLTSLFNYINDCETVMTWWDLVQFAIDYKMYQEFYMNTHILKYLIDEHNEQIRNGTWHKPA